MNAKASDIVQKPNAQRMMRSPYIDYARDMLAILVVGGFLFPLVWWGLTSLKPVSAIFNKDEIVWFDFTPSLDNYRVTLLGGGPAFFSSRQSIIDTLCVALGATALTLAAALPAAYVLSSMTFTGRRGFVVWQLFHRLVPPLVVVLPMVFMFHAIGLRDTRPGLILAHTTLNLPFALLLLKSFFEDVPKEVAEAAYLDGATRFQCFLRIHLPLIRGGIASTVVLCFIFSWTEFLMALFLTDTIRLLPVQLSLVVTQTWGFTAALSTASILPGFIFILLVQRNLVRGLTLGMQKA